MNTSISLSTQKTVWQFFDQFCQTMLPENIAINALRLLALVVQQPEQIAKQNAQTWQNWLAEYEQNQSVAFGNTHHLLSQMTYDEVQPLVSHLIDIQNKNLLDKQGKIELIQTILSSLSSYRDVRCHDSVYELLNAILAQYGSETVYVPFDSIAYSVTALSEKQAVAWENHTHYLGLPELLSLILDNVQYQKGNAIENPAYLEKRELKKFTKGFVLPPFGMKFQAAVEPRFAVPSQNITHLYIQHLLQQTSDIALVCVPIGQLHSTISAEVAFREWLVNQGVLKAVIQFPANLLVGTNVVFSLLVLEPNAQHDNIQFIHLKSSEFVVVANRETQLTQIDKLADLLVQPASHSACKVVSRDEIAAQNYVLDAERYVIDDETEKVLSILAKSKTCALENVVDILRPIANAKLKDAGTERIFEVQASDIPEYGYIQAASKEIDITANLLQKSAAQFLQADDIILTVRGSTGKVGIVSADLVAKYGNRAIVGQTGLILRVKNPDVISAKSLLMQLRSPLGQQQLKLISTGEVIPSISLKDLKDFNVILSTLAERTQAEYAFDEQTKIQEHILEQQKKLAELGNSIWTI